MKKTSPHILLFIVFINSFFLQGQTSISKKDVFRKQIQALTEQRNFITKSACPQREDVLKEYQANFDKLIDVLNIATLVFHTPITIQKDRIKEQGEHFIKYQSSNLTFVTVKRHHSKISMAGIVSDNSSSSAGAKLLTETFTLKDKEIEVLYRIYKNKITLITLETKYKDHTRIYISFQSPPQAHFSVYNTNEYGTENNNLDVLMSNEIGQVNLIKTTGYELYPEQYTEMVTQNQGLIKHRYAIQCYDDNGNQITPTKKGNDIKIKPTTYLLWYKGTIGKHPIHLMLKRGFVEEYEEVKINDTIILNVLYAYDSQKKWINLENLWEPQAGIFGFEGQDDSPEWRVEFSANKYYNKELTGEWDNRIGTSGTLLPITLTPLAKEFPKFTFKAQIEEELAPSGKVANQSIIALDVYKNNKKIQQINLENDKPDLTYFDLNYADINYDGYLDLIVDDHFLLYNPSTKKFDIPKDEEGEWYYIPNLTDLYSYNPYTKSFTVQHRRSFMEYRATNGKMIPYWSESYYPDENGNMISLKEKYINGKWETIEKIVENMEDDEDESVNNDIGDSKNYTLNLDLTASDGVLLFTPIFYNNTGQKLTFKQPAKFYTEVIDTHNKTHQQFLYNVGLPEKEGKNYIDDSYISFDGKNYFYTNGSNLIPFFSPNLVNGDYTFRLVLEHPLFGKLKSKTQLIHLPLPLKTDSAIAHFKGSINNKVKGSIYFKVNDKKVVGTFINTKTGKSIKLKGNYTSGFFGADTLNLEEYEKDDVLSGYFEGTINMLKGEDEGVYDGYWLSPDKISTRVPFKFKKQ